MRWPFASFLHALPSCGPAVAPSPDNRLPKVIYFLCNVPCLQNIPWKFLVILVHELVN